MHRSSHQRKAASHTGLTVAQIDALIGVVESRCTRVEYRHEQREELSAAKRDLESHTAKIRAYAQAFATVTESISGLIKSLTPARAAAYAAAFITILNALVHLLH